MISRGATHTVVYHVVSSACNRDESAFPRVQLAGKDWRS